MTEFIDYGGEQPLNFNQRWNGYLALVALAVALFLGLTLRGGTLSASQTFEDLEAGVRAQVPVGWLLDAQGDDYVFQAIDPDALPFKTTLQVTVLTVGPDATPNIVLDILTVQRSARLANYVEISRTDETLGDDQAKRLVYAYTEFERNPFLQSLPLVIKGVDVVVLRRGQAVVVTYREESNSFDDNVYRFENLLATVEIF